MDLEKLIENAWVDRDLLNEKGVILAIKTVVDDLDIGRRRIAESENGSWQVNEWLKKAVILYFPLMKMQLIEVGPFQFHDKIKLKTGYDLLGVRVVPQAVARYGSFINKGCVLMHS